MLSLRKALQWSRICSGDPGSVNFQTIKYKTQANKTNIWAPLTVNPIFLIPDQVMLTLPIKWPGLVASLCHVYSGNVRQLRSEDGQVRSCFAVNVPYVLIFYIYFVVEKPFTEHFVLCSRFYI